MRQILELNSLEKKKKGNVTKGQRLRYANHGVKRGQCQTKVVKVGLCERSDADTTSRNYNRYVVDLCARRSTREEVTVRVPGQGSRGVTGERERKKRFR